MRLSAFLILMLGGWAVAAPPVVTAPAEVKGEPSTFVTVRAEVKDATAVKFVPLDGGLSVFPADLLTTKVATVVVASKAGKYRILCYAGNADGASDPVFITLVIGDVPPVVAPPKYPPTDPVVPPTTKKHFMFVRPSGVGIPKAIEDAMNLPAWAEVKAAGHSYADLPFNDLPESARTQFAGQPLPFLLTWEVSGNTIKLPAGAKAQPAPLTNDAVRGLLK